jgi:hypothetical protein
MSKYSEDIQVEQPAIDLFDQLENHPDFDQQIASPLL